MAALYGEVLQEAARDADGGAGQSSASPARQVTMATPNSNRKQPRQSPWSGRKPSSALRTPASIGKFSTLPTPGLSPIISSDSGDMDTSLQVSPPKRGAHHQLISPQFEATPFSKNRENWDIARGGGLDASGGGDADKSIGLNGSKINRSLFSDSNLAEIERKDIVIENHTPRIAQPDRAAKNPRLERMQQELQQELVNDHDISQSASLLIFSPLKETESMVMLDEEGKGAKGDESILDTSGGPITEPERGASIRGAAQEGRGGGGGGGGGSGQRQLSCSRCKATARPLGSFAASAKARRLGFYQPKQN